MRDLVRVSNTLFDHFLDFNALLLDLVHLFDIFQHANLLRLLFLLLLAHRLLIDTLSSFDRPIFHLFQLGLLRLNFGLVGMLLLDQSGHDDLFIFSLTSRCLVSFGRHQLTVLFVSLEGLLELAVIVLSFLVLSLNSLTFLLAGIPEDLRRRLSCLPLSLQTSLLLHCSALLNLRIEHCLLCLSLICNMLLLGGFLVSQLLLPDLICLLLQAAILTHFILQLAFVVLLRHLPIQHELLV